VIELKAKIEKDKPLLAEKTIVVNKEKDKIQEKKDIADIQGAEVFAKREIVNANIAEVTADKNKIQAEIDKAEPELKEAIKKINALEEKDLSELFSYKSPSENMMPLLTLFLKIWKTQ